MNKKILAHIYAILFLLFIYACHSEPKQETQDSQAVTTVQQDTIQLVQNFMCGLWSLDSSQNLTNVGYYFMSDGTVNFVGADASGSWKVINENTISISYYSDRREIGQTYHLDSLSESQMILSDSAGTYVFRKVPFGLNQEESLINGFHGTLMPGQAKEYTFTIPSAKKLRIALKCNDANVKMRVFDSKKELTSVALNDWQSIMVRSGNYKILVDYVDPKKAEMQDFDLKVLGQ